MKYPQHDEALPVRRVAEDIGRIQDLEHEFAKFGVAGKRPPDQRMFSEDRRLGLYFSGNNTSQAWVSRVRKRGEAIKIGQRGGRPFEFQRPAQDLKPGVPQLSSQRTTSECGTVGSPALIAVH